MLHRLHLALPPDELGPAADRALQPRAQGSQAGDFVNVDRLADAFDFGWTKTVEDEVALAELPDLFSCCEPIGASTCIRAARLAVCPIGVYSVCASPVWIKRTTTSPVFTPTRACSGNLPSCRMRSE